MRAITAERAGGKGDWHCGCRCCCVRFREVRGGCCRKEGRFLTELVLEVNALAVVESRVGVLYM